MSFEEDIIRRRKEIANENEKKLSEKRDYGSKLAQDLCDEMYNDLIDVIAVSGNYSEKRIITVITCYPEDRVCQSPILADKIISNLFCGTTTNLKKGYPYSYIDLLIKPKDVDLWRFFFTSLKMYSQKKNINVAWFMKSAQEKTRQAIDPYSFSEVKYYLSCKVYSMTPSNWELDFPTCVRFEIEYKLNT